MDFTNMINDLTQMQDSGEKYAFRKIAMEGLQTPQLKSKMINILYKDIMTAREIQYVEIDATKGDFTKFKYYDTFTRSLEAINNLIDTNKPVELQDLNRLHEILIEARGDFEYGYKFDVNLIQAMYGSVVLAALEMLNIMVVAYRDFLTDPSKVLFKFRSKTGDDANVVRNVHTIVTIYNKGEWKALINEFKRASKNLLAGAVAVVGKAMLISGAIIALFYAVREFIYTFYKTKYNIAEWAKLQNQFLTEAIKQETDAKALRREKFVSNKLETLASFLEGKSVKLDVEAKKNIKESTKKKINKQTLSNDEVAPPVMKQNEDTYQNNFGSDDVEITF